MSTTEAKKKKIRKEPVFPSRTYFESFIEDVENAARGSAVNPENIRIIVEHLKEEFGKELPEELQW